MLFIFKRECRAEFVISIMNSLELLSILILWSCIQVSAGISCKDDNNRDVDWFILYKLPKIDSEPKGSALKEGRAYAYLTSDSPSKWKLSAHGIDSEQSMFGNTWQNFASKQQKEDTAHIFYNDETPESQRGSTAMGHLKGVVAFDQSSGFWLIHSVPRFGELDHYEYPGTAMVNGQSAMCVSTDIEGLNEICNHLIYCHPNIYQIKIADSILPKLDRVAKTLFTKKPAYIKKKPFVRETNIKSLGGQKFFGFAKDNQEKVDIYSDIIAPRLNSSLIAATWRRGAGGNLAADCDTQHTVVDVVSLSMPTEDRSSDIAFKSSEDHSKWAIGLDGKKAPWVCVGDMNRMKSQSKRGGGTLCLKSKEAWKAFRSIIDKTGECEA